MSLKERIYSLCKKNGLTGAQLERELEFAKGYISKLDNVSPSQKTLQKIATKFDVSIDYLVTGKERQEIDSEDFCLLKDKSLVVAMKKMQAMSEEKRYLLIHLIDQLSK